MKRKELKSKAKKTLKRNYWTTVLVCVIALFFVGEFKLTSTSFKEGLEQTVNYMQYGKYELTSNLIEDGVIESDSKKADSSLQKFKEDFHIENGVVKGIIDFLEKSSHFFKRTFSTILNINVDTAMVITSLIGLLVALLIKIFISNVLVVGMARYFLETRKYVKTKAFRILFGFKEGYIRKVKACLLKATYLLLWSLTIVGGMIKYYSYRLVPYILAENPDLTARKVITLSRKMMKGYKFQTFKLDLSFSLWNILDMFTFGLLGIFYVNPYYSLTMSELYVTIKENSKKDKIENIEKVNDKKLWIEKIKDYYPGTEKINDDKYFQKYSILFFIMCFFVFSFFGWIWEVTLHLVKDGVFVNRGTMLGPWLPIYGAGCVIILIVFVRKTFKNLLQYPFVIFFLIMFVCGLLEYLSAWSLETFKCLKYWDYTGNFLNIQGRVCFEGLVIFGLGGLACIYFIINFKVQSYILLFHHFDV